MKWLSDQLDRLSQIAITILLMWMTVVLFIQVGGRYLMDSGMAWTEEMARYAMIWTVFLGAAVATKDGSQIRVPVLEHIFPMFKKHLKWLQNIVFIIYLVLVIVISWDTLKVVYFQSSPNMGISMAIVYAIMPVSFLFMLVHVLTLYKKRG